MTQEFYSARVERFAYEAAPVSHKDIFHTMEAFLEWNVEEQVNTNCVYGLAENDGIYDLKDRWREYA